MISCCISANYASFYSLACLSSAAYALSASICAFVLRRFDWKKSQMMRVLTCCLSMCAALPLLVEIAELRWKASANYGCILMFRFRS